MEHKKINKINSRRSVTSTNKATILCFLHISNHKLSFADVALKSIGCIFISLLLVYWKTNRIHFTLWRHKYKAKVQRAYYQAKLHVSSKCTPVLHSLSSFWIFRKISQVHVKHDRTLWNLVYFVSSVNSFNFKFWNQCQCGIGSNLFNSIVYTEYIKLYKYTELRL